MSGQHTPTPWVMDMDEDSDYWLVGNNQPYGIVSNPVVKLHNEDNAERIVDCVNACEGMSNEELKGGLLLKAMEAKINRTEQQRDELLALLVRIDKDGIFGTKALEDIAAAIAKAESC